jgi:hypothetical protein
MLLQRFNRTSSNVTPVSEHPTAFSDEREWAEVAVPNGMKVPTPFEYVFPHGCLFLGVEPATDFDRRGQGDDQRRDKETGERVWLVKVMDLDPEAGKFGASEGGQGQDRGRAAAGSAVRRWCRVSADGGVHRSDVDAVRGFAEVQGRVGQVPGAVGVVGAGHGYDATTVGGQDREGCLNKTRVGGGPTTAK